MVKNPPASVAAIEDMSSILGLGRSPGGGNGNPLQYSCLENPMDRGAWGGTVHGVAKSWTRLKRLSTHAASDTQAGGGRHLNLKTWVLPGYDAGGREGEAPSSRFREILPRKEPEEEGFRVSIWRIWV